MRKKMLALTFVLLIGVGVGAIAGLRTPSLAVSGNAPVEYKEATIDGDPADWSPLTTRIPMFEAGDPTKDNPSSAHLRYDCKNETLNVLVLAESGFTLIDMASAAWATVEEPAGNKTAPYNGNFKLYTGASGIDGAPPEFSWIAHDPAGSVTIGEETFAVVDGYEASFRIPPGSYSSLVVHAEFAKNIVDGSGQPGTSANVGFGKASEVTPLLLECDSTEDVLPDVTVAKDAAPTAVPETGGEVTFTFTATNNATEDATIASLTDSIFGTLSGDGDCQIGTALAAGASCSFELTKLLAGDFPDTHANTFSAAVTDREGNTDTDADDATVEFTDVLPAVSVTKTAGTSSVITGGTVTFTFTVRNDSLEPAVIDSLTDSVYGTLPGDADCKVGITLAPGASCSFDFTGAVVGTPASSGLGFDPHVNVFTGTVSDDDGNSASNTDDATVTVLWNGRTPGYWKNKPANWPSGMVIKVNGTDVTITTGTLVKQTFSTVPAVCFKNGVIDLNADRKDDTLLASLGYQGGSTLCGGVQILLRAGTAALLNEQVFAGTYPGGTSVEELYLRINTALLSGDRATMIALASNLDYWNNGVH
jgi:hypothetical protein